jgi:drug/metabolite transporter (DMT)-like permease
MGGTFNLMAFSGEIAALLTSLMFSGTSTFFTLAGRRVGSLVLNRLRLLVAFTLLALAHWWFLGSLLPLGAEPNRWFWLAISGVVGLVIGDAFLFQAFIWIGPRLSMLLMSLAPIIAALLAWIFFGETLSLAQLLGVAVTLAGVAWVVLERNRGARPQDLEAPSYARGILYGLGGATGQAVGLVTAKLGAGGDFSALSGTLIRMLSAMLLLWMITIAQRQAGATFRQLAAKPQALVFILAGAFTGPFIGVTLSLVAVQRTEIGVASTLMALPPVFLLPISYFVFKERYGWQAILGTLVALVGVGILFLV